MINDQPSWPIRSKISCAQCWVFYLPDFKARESFEWWKLISFPSFQLAEIQWFNMIPWFQSFIHNKTWQNTMTHTAHHSQKALRQDSILLTLLPHLDCDTVTLWHRVSPELPQPCWRPQRQKIKGAITRLSIGTSRGGSWWLSKGGSWWKPFFPYNRKRIPNNLLLKWYQDIDVQPKHLERYWSYNQLG